MLNNDQQTCYDFLKDKESGYFLIEGFAGTGKTYLAQELIKHYLSLGKKVIGIAPTHQAKLQLQESFNSIKSKQLEFSTVASFLRVERKEDKITGEEIYSEPSPDYSFVDSNTVLLIDETSMLTKTYINSLFSFSDICLVIFLGDFEQLPPITEKHNRHLFHPFNIFTLTIQQRNHGEILDLCNSLRSSTKLPDQSSGNIEVINSRNDFFEELINNIKINPDPFGISYLAFTNKSVNSIRNKIHYELYKNNDYNVGQYVRLEKPCEFGFVGEIFIVTYVEKMNINLFEELDFNGYLLRIMNVITGISGTVLALNFDNQDDVIACAKEMYQENRTNHYEYKKIADSNKKEKERARKKWQSGVDKVKTVNKVMFLSSPYSLTIHKSQGRTIRNVYLDTNDILRYKNDINRNLLYVGASRAKDKLIIKK